HHDDGFLVVATLDAEGDDVAGPDTVDRADRPLDVLGEHVATADDDDVLDATAHHELAVDEVGEVAGAQPPVVEEGLGGRTVVVVAAAHRGAPDLELADHTLGELDAGAR